MSLHVRPLFYVPFAVAAYFIFHASGLAQFQPIVLTPETFTCDVIVEKSAPPPALPVTTASMETGGQNSGFTWFEKGYVGEWPAAGLPPACATISSELSLSHRYQMPCDYHAKNAFMIDALEPSALVTFVCPSNYATLSFLTSSGLAQDVIGFQIYHQDGTSQKGTFISPNWYSVLDPACTGYGCVNTTSFILSDVNSYNPKLYSVDVKLVNVFSPVTRVALSLSEGVGHTAVFAVSGAPIGAGPFVPIDITGYNEDVVVENDAIKPGFIETNTTATMDNGLLNRAFTWFERGYNPLDPQIGLPAAGATVTSTTDALRRFTMPPTFEGPNAILLDRTCTNVEVALPTPTCYSALSFLTASGQGTTTNRCVVFHADGSIETNRIVSPYWLGNTPGAILTGACVSVSTRLLDLRNVGPPQLYAVDVLVTNRASKVTSFVLSPEAPAANTHAFFLAVSGLPAGITPPVRPVLTIAKGATNSLVIRSSATGQLESSLSPAIKTSWTPLATITTNLTLPINPKDKSRFYRVVVP
jgi:hypothetical protein